MVHIRRVSWVVHCIREIRDEDGRKPVANERDEAERTAEQQGLVCTPVMSTIDLPCSARYFPVIFSGQKPW